MGHENSAGLLHFNHTTPIHQLYKASVSYRIVMCYYLTFKWKHSCSNRDLRREEVWVNNIHLRQKCPYREWVFIRGVTVNLRLCPAPAHTGVVFKRTDLDGFTIEAQSRHVARVSYATSLMKKGVLISTTEHLLSALAGLGS